MIKTRICIAGGPKTGKTTLANKEGQALPGLTVKHTDDLIELGWSEASLAASKWFDEPGPWLIEGVAVPRALRKWLAAHDKGTPCDMVVYLKEPLVELSDGQASMAKGCLSVWRDIEWTLKLRGVQVLYGSAEGS